MFLPLCKITNAIEQPVFLRIVDLFVPAFAKNFIWKNIPVAMPTQPLNVDEDLVRSSKAEIIHDKLPHLSAGQLKAIIAKQS